MASWPSISTPAKVNEAIVKVAHRSSSEAGYVHTRAKWTSNKRTFSLAWNVMTSANKATLETFFDTNQGTTFSWTHPDTDASHTCLFSDDSIQFKSISNGLWSVTVSIEEQQ